MRLPPIKLESPRMDALAERFASSFAESERIRGAAIEADDDVSPEEMLALVLRGALASAASAMSVIAEYYDAPALEVRSIAIDHIDELLAEWMDLGRPKVRPAWQAGS